MINIVFPELGKDISSRNPRAILNIKWGIHEDLPLCIVRWYLNTHARLYVIAPTRLNFVMQLLVTMKPEAMSKAAST